jgi:glycosyltransferase involved in cell wall biosynthesis
MSNLLLSIITPAYNREDCIGRCIESVQNNTNKKFEHIIIDDGSTDNTYAIAKNLQEKFQNIRIIRNEENKGVNYSRKKGIEESNGEFILILDSDDKLKEYAIETIFDTITKNPEYRHYLFLPDDMVKIYKNVKKLQNENAVIEFRDWLSGEVWGDFVHVIKRECFDKIKFDENYRIYEGITFLKLYKENKEQFFTREIISERERDRKDSVSREYELKNKRSINNQYRILKKEIEEFGEDFRELGLVERFEYINKRAIILGMASGEYKGIKQLFVNSGSLILKIIYKLRAGIIVRYLIYMKSYMNTLVKEFK